MKNKLRELIANRDWARDQATEYESEANKYELQGRTEMLIVARKMYEHEMEDLKDYSNAILEIERRIKWLTLKYSAALKKRQNYATMKMKEPPSD